MLACDAVLMEDVKVARVGNDVPPRVSLPRNGASAASGLDGLAAFVSHGRTDSDLSFSAGHRLANFLTSAGAAVTWVPFEGGHEIPFAAWKRFKQFTQEMLRVATENIPHAP